MTTMAPKPSTMPRRRQESSPAPTVTVKPVERTFRRRTGYMSNSTLADQLVAVVDPELLYRRACDQACDRVQTHAEEVPEGKATQRWQQKTAEAVKVLLELWFGLDEGTQPSVLPPIMKVAQRIFVEICVELKVVGAPGQKAEWYPSLEQQIKVAPKPSEKTEQKAVVTTVVSDAKPDDKKDLGQLYKETAGHLQRYARKVVTRGNKKSQRWSETTLDLAVTLLKAYFLGVPQGELERQLNDTVITETRKRFAYTCIKQGLSDIPGQQCPWYPGIEENTRCFINSQRASKTS